MITADDELEFEELDEEEDLAVVNELWEQKANEPMLWFSRFEKYRELSKSERSVLRVYNLDRKERGKEASKGAPTVWGEMAKLYEWEARADAWDKQMIRRNRLNAVMISQLKSDIQKQIFETYRDKVLELVQSLDPTGEGWKYATAAVKLFMGENRLIRQEEEFEARLKALEEQSVDQPSQ